MKRKKKYFRFSSISGERKIFVYTYDFALATEKIRRGGLIYPHYRELIYLGEGRPLDFSDWHRCTLEVGEEKENGQNQTHR